MSGFDEDWKNSLGFPINYYSDQSSGDDIDTSDVVLRRTGRQRSAGYLLADKGDGAPADLLGTTPPRARIRDKEKRRTNMDNDVCPTRLLKFSNRKSAFDVTSTGQNSPDPPERVKKRASMILRNRERDLKMDLSHKTSRDGRADSLPSPGAGAPAVPTLVESCSRFMSLTSKLKCRARNSGPGVCQEVVEDERQVQENSQLQSRANFHNTFSLIINMGNVNKNCRRTISLEEQVWQNELKDLIWLELQAKLSGRSIEQQDVFLCTQRKVVPAIVRNIIDYRFVNSKSCRGRSRSLVSYDSEDDHSVTSNDSGRDGDDDDNDQDGAYQLFGCLSFNCMSCIDGLGKALKEVGTLLDSFYNAEALYPSSKTMAAHHPLIATQLFNNRLKAMCQWYNITLNMRLRILAVRRLINSIQHKTCLPNYRQLPSTDSDTNRSMDLPRSCTVRFTADNKSPSDSNNSESSANSDDRKDLKDCPGGTHQDKQECEEKRTSDVSSSDGVPPEEEPLHSDLDQSGGTTPEVIGEFNNGTIDTTVSTESGYLSDKVSSTNSCGHLVVEDSDVYNMGPLHEVVMLRLLKKCDVSPYRQYHYDILKTQGVRKSMMFINKMRMKILNKVFLTFERVDHLEDAQTNSTPEPGEEDAARYEEAKLSYELKRYGCWSEETLQMRLPSYRSHFLLLNTICIETVHDYLSLRLDTQPANPSCLTVKQLIHELKEGIDIATDMRNAFVRNKDVALDGYPMNCGARQDLQRIITTFDTTLDTVVKQYLSYLSTMSSVEIMSRSFLESEWCFSAVLAQRVRSAATLVPNSFTDIICNQLDILLNRFNEHFASLMIQKDNYPEGTLDVDAKSVTKLCRHFVYAVCREAQNIYSNQKEMTMQTVHFARLLATRLRKSTDFAHCRERIFNSLMKIGECIAVHTAMIVEKTSEISWEEDLAESLQARLRELLLQLYKLGFELHKELYKYVYGATDRQWCPEEVVRRPVSLQPRRPPPSTAHRRRRPDTILVNRTFNALVENNLLHKELHRFVNDGTTHPGGHCAPNSNRARFFRSESIGGEDFNTGIFDDLPIYQSIPSVGGSLAECCAGRQEERRWQERVSRAIVHFATCWMHFVMERCDRGRGLRPRWANQGLEFLILSCDPNNTEHLSDKEFEDMKVVMDACISHVIGSCTPPARVPDVATPPPRRHNRPRVHSPCLSGVPAPPTPPTEPDPLLNFNIQPHALHKSRVLEAVTGLDQSRDNQLRRQGAVGRVLESAAVTSYEPKLRQVTFKWQRGLKIGAGTFGKVYTVVNTETGQLLAMKELAVAAGDRRAVQRAANELRVLEGVIHPHLVRYYGCELHREELLLFMELCVEGSLEALLASAGALPETQVRRYCKQLVSAILELHARKIAHRDIKSGNIFLTNEGHCLKLGDFGCAVKIRANTTAPAELQGCVGTQAYMAPEVFMKSGHGRAADIWSLGCVVTEMASGKRPFSEYDSNYQIMFLVGMGGRPASPSTLSHEGQQFCLACLTHDPAERPRAEQLMLHHFLMVKADEDCNCEPSYLISKK